MKKNKFILLYIASTGLLLGCYKDKGNYDYKDVNEMTVSMLPTANNYNSELYTYSYVYRQPGEDTVEVTYTPQVEQTLIMDEANLQYEWIIKKTGQSKVDTVRTKLLTLKLAPKESTNYQVVFRVSDLHNQLNIYRRLSVKTEVPFVKSWFVLHGEESNRFLGTIEYPDRGNDAEILLDSYYTVHGLENPFKEANDLMYLAMDGSDFNSPEHLTILETNKSYYMHAFDLLIKPRGYNLMVPDPAERIRLSYGVTNSTLGRFAIIVTEDGKFIHGGQNGFYHKPIVEQEYKVDKAYITSEGYLLIWDKHSKQFSYYNFQDNWYTWYNGPERPTDVANNAILTPFPKELFEINEMTNKEVLWMGATIESGVQSGSAVVIKDLLENKYWLYNVRIGGDGNNENEGPIVIKKQLLPDIELDNNSLFATSEAFDQQFFYTLGESLFHYNMVSNERKQIYSIDPGMRYSHIKFRASEWHYNLTNENFKLGIAVESYDGKNGQLHEVTFNQSADVMGTTQFKGNFGPIKDLEFSTIQRIIL